MRCPIGQNLALDVFAVSSGKFHLVSPGMAVIRLPPVEAQPGGGFRRCFEGCDSVFEVASLKSGWDQSPAGDEPLTAHTAVANSGTFLPRLQGLVKTRMAAKCHIEVTTDT